jgi:D-3-phosphoglycerate dehydrogenase / 2-oxoglutarate reductase
MKKKIKKILISSYHMNLKLYEYEKLLKKNNIEFDKLIRNPSVKENELLNIIEKYDGIICSDDEITKKVIQKARLLKVISKWGTGTDSIDKIFAKKKNIKVLNTPNAFSKSVAQLVWSMILAFSRNLIETQNEIKTGKWPKLDGTLLQDKTLGIIGLGNVGQAVAKMSLGFDMKILCNDIKKINNNLLKKLKITQVSKNKILKKSDYIVLCVDLNKSSYKLIDQKELLLMKKNTILINVARGPVINEPKLIKALKNHRIKGAGLDVFRNEPITKKNPLFRLKNCILSSHNAFNTREEVDKVHKNTVINLINGLKK